MGAFALGLVCCLFAVFPDASLAQSGSQVGGLSAIKPPDDQVIQAVIAVQKDLGTHLGAPLDTVSVVSYKTQIVAGINYFAKVQIGEKEYIHVRIYQPPGGVPSLTSVQVDKTPEDDIVYF